MYRSRIATTFLLSAFLSLASFSFASAVTVAAPAPGTNLGGGTGLGGDMKSSMKDSNIADLQCPAPVEKKTAYEPKEKPYPATFRLKNTDASINIQVQNLYGKPCRDVRNDVEVVEGKCQSKDVCKATECYSKDCKLPDTQTGAGGTAQQTDPARQTPLELAKDNSLNKAPAMGERTGSLIEKAILGETFSGPMSPSYFSEFQSFSSLDFTPQSSFPSSGYESPAPSFSPEGSPSNFGPINEMSPPSGPPTGPSMMSPDASAPVGSPPVSGFGPPSPDGGVGHAPLSPSGLPPDPWSAQSPALTSGLDGKLDASGQPISSLTPEVPKTNWEGANPKYEFPYLSAQQIAASGIGTSPTDQIAASFTSPDSTQGELQAPSSEVKTPADIASAVDAPAFQTGSAVKSVVPIAADLSGNWVSKGSEQSNFGTLVSGANDWWVNGSSACTNIACAVNIDAESPYVAFGPTPEQLAAQAETVQQYDANGNAISSSPPPPIIASGEAPMWGGAPITGFDANGNPLSENQNSRSVKVAEAQGAGDSGVVSDVTKSAIPWEKISLQEAPKGPAETTGSMIENAQKEAGLTPSNESQDAASKPANYLAAEREKLMAELDTNPALRDKVAAVIKNEIDTKEGSQAVLESMVNRAVLRGYTSLDQAVNDQFYGPVKSGAVDADLRKGVTADNVPYVNEAIAAVKSGSNICNYCTDQGQSWEIKGQKTQIGGEYFGNMGGDSRWADEQRAREAAYVGQSGSGSGQLVSNAGGNDLPYSSRPPGSYLDQQPLQNASYYGGDVVNTSANLNGGWANNGSIEDWNAGYAAVPPTFAAEHNGSVADWNAGFASAPATLATENNGTVADWNAGFAAVPAPLAAEYNGTIAEWNAGYAAVPQPLVAERNGTVEDWYAGFGAVPPKLAAEQNGTLADWNAGFASNDALRTDVAPALPAIPVPGEMKISDVPPSAPDKPVEQIPLPTARPEITANTNVPLPQSRPEITVSGVPLPTARPDVPANEVPLPPSRPEVVENGIPLPQARPEGAPTATAVQEGAHQPPLERLANPDAKPWNSVEENSGNPYDSGGQKLVTLRCQGGGGVCGADSGSAAVGGTPLAGDMQGVAVPRDNPLGLKIGDKVNVQVGDKTVENVPVTDYTRSGSNNYVASGGLEKELGGTGRDAAVITRPAPEVPLPVPRPQDVDGNGNPIERATPTIAPERETEKVIPIEDRIPVPTWAPDPFKAEYAKAVEQQVLDEMSLKDRAVLGYGQTPPDQLNPTLPPLPENASTADIAPTDESIPLRGTTLEPVGNIGGTVEPVTLNTKASNLGEGTYAYGDALVKSDANGVTLSNSSGAETYIPNGQLGNQTVGEVIANSSVDVKVPLPAEIAPLLPTQEEAQAQLLQEARVVTADVNVPAPYWTPPTAAEITTQIQEQNDAEAVNNTYFESASAFPTTVTPEPEASPQKEPLPATAVSEGEKVPLPTARPAVQAPARIDPKVTLAAIADKEDITSSDVGQFIKAGSAVAKGKSLSMTEKAQFYYYAGIAKSYGYQQTAEVINDNPGLRAKIQTILSGMLRR